MTETEIILTVIGIINALIAAILAVILSQYLQGKSKKREDKFKILIDLMVSRIYGWTPNSVHSMNVIDIIFADSKKVKDAWHKYFDLCKVNNPSATQLNDVEIAKNKLIEIIANSLGYKDKLTWDEIQSVYVPKGLDDNLRKQQKFQNIQMEVTQIIRDKFGVQTMNVNKQE